MIALAPVVLVAIGEIVRRELGQVVAVGPEMVVDDVENDAEAERMGAIDERAKIVGRAVEARRRIEIDAVVAPAERPAKSATGIISIDRDAEIGERGQFAPSPLPTCPRA